ncbi:hypothetical protein NDU88_007518 [Pleurodeles waltl]|uniref:Uncharacterized protein n=1 Tax=Pleurodeles waltl TaxID=8319 RepID=A0AAV7U0W9_PLEWA|nr:hypothetical protein NDU88_007518 [Pleurodeles waltl]
MPRAGHNLRARPERLDLPPPLRARDPGQDIHPWPASTPPASPEPGIRGRTRSARGQNQEEARALQPTLLLVNSGKLCVALGTGALPGWGTCGCSACCSASWVSLAGSFLGKVGGTGTVGEGCPGAHCLWSLDAAPQPWKGLPVLPRTHGTPRGTEE